LVKLLLYILFEKNIYIYIYIHSIENGLPGEPALCQLYRHSFVAYFDGVA